MNFLFTKFTIIIHLSPKIMYNNTEIKKLVEWHEKELGSGFTSSQNLKRRNVKL